MAMARVPLAAEVAAVARAEPEAHEVPSVLRTLRVLVPRAAVHDHAVVQHLDLAALDPEIEAMVRVAHAFVHQSHRLSVFRVERAACLFVAAPHMTRRE